MLVTMVHNVLFVTSLGDLSLKSFRNGHAFSEHVICFNLMDLVRVPLQKVPESLGPIYI